MTVAAWLARMDYVAGAESDSGHIRDVFCPSCEHEHRVHVSRLGRFLFACGEDIISGALDDWPPTNPVVVAERGTT